MKKTWQLLQSGFITVFPNSKLGKIQRYRGMVHDKVYDVLGIGIGVTNGAYAFVMTMYTNVMSFLFLEKYFEPGMVNSSPDNNAQTSHEGDTETNFVLSMALKIKLKARMLRNYVLKKNVPGLYRITKRMVFAHGEKNVKKLRDRFAEFSPHYPHLRLIGAEELWKIEPNIMKGRDPNEPVCALISDEGFAIDYQLLSKCLIEDAKASDKDFTAMYQTEVYDVWREDDIYHVVTNRGTFKAKFLMVAAGSYSLWFAKKLGLGKQFTIFPVKGSFYSAGHLVDNKIYQPQDDERPFAAPHADPDLLNPNITRFGPTTRFFPFMETRHILSILTYLRLGILTIAGILSLMNIVIRKSMLWYITKNFFFDIPWLGRYFYAKEARSIIPTIRAKDLELRRGKGGIRPQVVDMEKKQLLHGDATIIGPKVIAISTPSPGASIAIGSAAENAKKTVEMLGEDYWFDEARFNADFVEPDPYEVAKQTAA